jgi:hypothetical protein
MVKYAARLQERMAEEIPGARSGDARRVFWLMYHVLEYVQRCNAMMGAGFFLDDAELREGELFKLIKETVPLLDQELAISDVNHDEEAWRSFVLLVAAIGSGEQGASARAAEDRLCAFMGSVGGYVPPYSP